MFRKVGGCYVTSPSPYSWQHRFATQLQDSEHAGAATIHDWPCPAGHAGEALSRTPAAKLKPLIDALPDPTS